MPLYRKLPGRGGGLFISSRLWLAKDHLLRTELRGFTEMYHRFYFTDIQAILVRPTNRWLVEIAVTGPLLVLFLLFALVAGGWFRVFWLIMAGLVAPFLILTLVRGRTCACHIQTAVQLMALPSVNRYRHARKILGLVNPMIEQAQGTMSTEQMLRELENAPPPIVSQARATAPVRPRAEEVAKPTAPERVVVRHSHGRWHEVFFWMLASDAMVTLAGFMVEMEFIDSLEWLLFFGLLACGITAWVKQHRTDLPLRLKQCVWTTFGAYALFSASVVVYAVILIFDGDLHALSDLDPATDTVVMWMDAIFFVVMLPLAATALFTLYRFRRAYAARTPVQPPTLPVEGKEQDLLLPETDTGHDGAWPFKPGTP